jgi:Protein of unknown function (DUF3987)/CHC2 zinc finger/Bifunctional DNA primase/polymerase, N-terminal
VGRFRVGVAAQVRWATTNIFHPATKDWVKSQKSAMIAKNIENLLSAIARFPSEWALTPCMGKQNLWPAWNKERLDRNVLIDAIQNQRNHKGKYTAWTGVSLISGPMSGGVMAIDFDGEAASEKYRELSDGVPLPITRMWTSGKPGHFQILLRVPESKWKELKPIKLELENGHKLEFRWNQCSTLPPSIHPDTKQPYYWENWEEFVPIAPDWVLDLMRDGGEEKPAITKQQPQHRQSERQISEILEQDILPRLDADDFYGEFVNLKRVGKTLKGLCPFHQEKTPSFTISPEGKTYHCFGCDTGGGPVQFLYQIGGGSGSPSGKEFIDIVRQLGDRVGVSLPELGDRKLDRQPKPTKLPANNNNNVVNFPPQQKQSMMTAEQIEQEIDTEIESGVTGSRLSIALNKIAASSGVGIREVRQIYAERVEERDRIGNREDTAEEIAQLLTSKSARLDIREVLPPSLAEPIDRLANKMNLRAECYLLALLTQCGSLLPANTVTMLHPPTDFWVRPNYFGAIVAESSQGKTVILKAIFSNPMAALLDKARSDFEAAQATYEAELANWAKDKGPAPKPPIRKVYSFTKQTGEGIAAQAGRLPEQGMLYLCDELAGMFKSANQYRGGKGSDEEDLLEYWSGGGARVLRVSGLTVDVSNVSLSIFGNIQPKVLAGFVGDGDDNNGKFARFDFIQQPLAVTKLSGDSVKVNLTPMLTDLYKKLDNLPIHEFELDDQAHDLFTHFHDIWSEQKISHPKQGMRAMIGKAAEKVGKLATILHCIRAAHLGDEVSPYISIESVRAAIKFVQYTMDQALSMNSEGEGKHLEKDLLTPNLIRVIELAKRKGGTVSVRDVQRSFSSKQQPTSQKIREWFSELITMQYGQTQTTGKSFQFVLLPTPTVLTIGYNPDTVSSGIADSAEYSVADSADSDKSNTPSDLSATSVAETTVGDAHRQSESLPDMQHNPIVSTVSDILECGFEALLFRVRSAQTWAEVQAVWNGDLELKARIKAALTREELVRFGQLYKAAHPEEFEKK